MLGATLPLAARFHVVLARTLAWASAGGAAWACGDALREAPDVPDLSLEGFRAPFRRAQRAAGAPSAAHLAEGAVQTSATPSAA